MSAIKPCPLLPGVSPVADKSRVIDGVHWICVSEAESPCRYIEGPAAPTEAAAIAAWDEWQAPLINALAFREQVEIAMDACTDPAQFRRTVADLLESIRVSYGTVCKRVARARRAGKVP